MRKLSVIIVTWNSEEDIIECLNSIYNHQQGDLEIETIVVDNNSADNTVKVVQHFIKLGFRDKVRLIVNNENFGFTKASNQGIESSTGDTVMLLNPDTEIIGNALFDLYERLHQDSTIVAIAPQLLTPNGQIQFSCRTLPAYSDLFYEILRLSVVFPRSKIFARWKMKYFDHQSERFVEQPMAAALMLKRNVLGKVAYLDERFSMFFNDVDLCKRIISAGYRILFYPKAKIYHKIGISILKDRVKMIRVWNEDCLKYFEKHHYLAILHFILTISLRITGFFRVIFTKLLYSK
ncbi:MAG: glycosyltransferase family 2 protein [Ignavibacteria bacterium]